MTEELTSDMAPEDAFLAQLDVLRHRYLARLPGLVARIADLSGLALETKEREQWREAHRLLHSLAGTAPTYGFTAVAQAARGLLALMTVVLDDPSASFPGPKELDQALERLRQAEAESEPLPNPEGPIIAPAP